MLRPLHAGVTLTTLLWLTACATSSTTTAPVAQCFQHAQTGQFIVEWTAPGTPRFALDAATRAASYTAPQGGWVLANGEVTGVVFYTIPARSSMDMYLVGGLGLERHVGVIDASCATRLADHLSRQTPPLPVDTMQALP